MRRATGTAAASGSVRYPPSSGEHFALACSSIVVCRCYYYYYNHRLEYYCSLLFLCSLSTVYTHNIVVVLFVRRICLFLNQLDHVMFSPTPSPISRTVTYRKVSDLFFSSSPPRGNNSLRVASYINYYDTIPR